MSQSTSKPNRGGARRPFWRKKSERPLANEREGGELERTTTPNPGADKHDVPSTSQSAPKGRGGHPRKPLSEVRDALAPSNLAKTSTPVNNDPFLGKDFVVIEGLGVLAETQQRREFNLNFSGFLALCRASYNAQVRYDRSLQKYISESMFIYYCVILLWKRIYQIGAARGEDVTEFAELRSLVSDDLAIPNDVQAYLSGMGDVIDQDYKRNILKVQASFTNHVEIGSQGFYGRLSHLNHYKYETIPSPGIAVLKMAADLSFTVRGVEGVADWTLPPLLRPANNPHGRPTTNLLCWSKAVKLTENQRDTLMASGFEIEDNVVAHSGVVNLNNVPVNQQLMIAVSQYMKSSKLQCYSAMPESVMGSAAQVLYTTRVAHDLEAERHRSISTKSGITRSPAQFPAGIAYGAVMFRYRLQRMYIGGRDCFCWQFRNAEDVVQDIPAQWIENADNVFEHGEAGNNWNRPNFSFGEVNGFDVLARCAERYRTRVTRA